ncbi:MAG: thioredoxin family protein [Prevotellaceae bacterium]|nr:thioredoxin family protein [Prevotellaceae bacterium]
MPENATVIQVNFCDPLSDEHRFAQDLTTSAGTFRVVHDYVFAQNLSIRYDRSFINLYVAPGDSVFLTIDGLKFQQHPGDAVTFSGDNAEINEQLFRWTAYFYHLPVPEFNPAGKEVVFINLCLDSSSDNWLKTIGKENIEGENYYLDADASKSFMGTYNISGFPTYMLIDRNGLLRSPVARPSSTLSVIEQIEAYYQDSRF